MNKLSIHQLSLLIALYVCAGTVHAQDNTQHPKTEIAVMEVSFIVGTTILITHPDERTETINVDVKGKDFVFAQHRAIRLALQRFYNAGWVIESEILLSHTPRAIYILKREVR